MLRGGVVAGGMAAFAAGYGETVVKAVAGPGARHGRRAHGACGARQFVDARVRIDPVSGVLSAQPGQTVSPSSCLGCWTQCGVRLRVDAKENRILRVAGNRIIRWPPRAWPPWNAGARGLRAAGRHNGLEGRATSCARLGHAGTAAQPVSRAAAAQARRSARRRQVADHFLPNNWCRKWRGRRPVRRGPWTACARSTTARRRWIRPTRVRRQVNQFLFTDASNEGRTPLIQRFAGQSFGTVNFGNHGSYCGQSFARERSAGRPERHAARRRIGTTRASACSSARRRPRPATRSSARRGSWPRRARGRRKRLPVCGGVARAAGLVQPVGRFGQ